MTKEIKLTKGMVALVDDEDYVWLSQFKWHAVTHSSGRISYARRMVKNSDGKVGAMSMHRAIMQPPDDMQIDHINHNGLDNRKENLRVCDVSTNARNRRKRTGSHSKYIGVTKHKKSGKWVARLEFNIGVFDDEEEAARAYDEVAKRVYTEHVRLNFTE